MLDFGPDTFLDMITLIVHKEFPKPLERSIVVDVITKLLVNIKEYIKIEPMVDTEENRFFINVTEELLISELTYEDKVQLDNFAVKCLKKFPKSEEPAIKRILSSTLLGEEKIEEKHLNVLFKRMRLTLMYCISDKELKEISYKMKKIKYNPDLLTQEVLFGEIFEQVKNALHEVKIIGASVENHTNVECINMSDKESVKRALQVHKLTRATTIFKTGLQGLNNMLGPGGFTLGETFLFGALSHNYKSGILMDAARWIVSYTEPPRFDNKQPIVLFISLENEAHKNLMNWYKRSYTLIHGVFPPADLSDDDIADVVNKAYSMNGWELHVIRRIGDYFGFEEYVEVHEDYKKQGKRVYATITDYLGCMRLGYKNSVVDSANMKANYMQDLTRKICNYGKHEHILNILAHQLGPEAGGIAATKCIYPVKKFQGSAHFADCKSVYKEVDGCILMHIEYNSNGVPFLTFNWSKHRDNVAPTIDRQFCGYPFTQVGILDDIVHPTSKALSDIYNYRPDGDTEAIEDESIFN